MSTPTAALMDNGAPAEEGKADFLLFTAPYDYSGHPPLTLPMAPQANELPGSFQLIGRKMDEETLPRRMAWGGEPRVQNVIINNKTLSAGDQTGADQMQLQRVGSQSCRMVPCLRLCMWWPLRCVLVASYSPLPSRQTRVWTSRQAGSKGRHPPMH